MRIKDGYLMRQVAGSYIVVAVSDKAADFDGVVTLNEVGADLWRLLEKDITKEALLAALLESYDVDEATAKADLDAFLEKAQTHGFLEV